MPTVWIRSDIKKATVWTKQGEIQWVQIGKGVWQDCMLFPYWFNQYGEYILWETGLKEDGYDIKIGGRNINNLFCTDSITAE